jgi:hypothetical protein
MIIIVIVILIFVNLIAGSLDIKADMTSSQYYSLSQESKDALAALNEDVTIYALARTGQEAQMLSTYVGTLTFKELLSEYENVSPRIKVEYKDPYLYPQFATQYAEEDGAVQAESLIVVSEKRHRVISPSEMITFGIDYNTYQQYVESVDIEPRITNAISYVSAENAYKIYSVTGNNEVQISESLTSQMGMAGFDIDSVDFATTDIPEDCDILFITQPSRDWTEGVAKRVANYLENDGRAIFAVSYVGFDMPVLNGVLEAYGVSIGSYIAVEGDQNMMADGPLYIRPNVLEHDISANLKSRQYNPVIGQASGVDRAAIKKNSTTIEDVLVTSGQAYGKVNMQTTTLEKEAGDVDGPITLMTAVTDSYYTDTQHTSKIVIVAANGFIDENLDYAVGGANYFVIVESLNWLRERTDAFYIPSKSLPQDAPLTLNQAQIGIMAFMSIVIIPFSILAVGFIVWLRRRHS